MINIKNISPVNLFRYLFLPKVNIGSSNGLVWSGTMPSHEPMLTKIHDSIWHHQGPIY